MHSLKRPMFWVPSIYLENRKTYGKSEMRIQQPTSFSSTALFETFFAPINIKRLILEMPAEAHVGVHAVFVIVLFQPQMKYLDIFYLDLSISNANNTKLIAQFCNLTLRMGQNNHTQRKYKRNKKII